MQFLKQAFLLTAIISVLFGFALSAQSSDLQYSKAKIFLEGKSLSEIARLGVAVDHGEHKKGVFFTGVFSEWELAQLNNAQVQYDILIDDVQQYYREQASQNVNKASRLNSNCSGPNTFDPVKPDNFDLGSYGGYFTYAEMFQHLDSMISKYPNLISTYKPIDSNITTHEGRYLYWLKISDNPEADEQEPEILYDALHHAREPGSMSQLIYYMWYLLENYASNPEIAYLVDNTEMYFVPCVNPDGYIENETTDPSGGGLWRKNKRDNQDGTFGVDLNRNYGYQWGLDNVGSSPDPNSDVYRGPSAFSEPETQLMRNFCIDHEFLITLNYHTYGNYLLYPWGYEESLFTPDSALYVSYAEKMTDANNYIFGTGDQTIGYITNGDSDDWMYGEQVAKNKSLSFTPEAGRDFWEPQSWILGTCQDNVYQNLMAARFLLEYFEFDDLSSEILSVSGYIPFSLSRLGQQETDTLTVSFTDLNGSFTQLGSPKIYTGLNLGEVVTDSFYYEVDAQNLQSNYLPIVVTLDYGNGRMAYDTLNKVYADQLEVALFDQGDDLNLWSSSSGWATTTSEFVSAPSSFTDSPSGNYFPNDDNRITLQNSIDLTDALAASLEFYAKWDIEAGFDYVQLLASPVNQSIWTPLCGRYTKTGGSSNAADEPHYDGISGWVKETVNLSDWVGQEIKLQFRLVSDTYVEGDGFCFDDLIVKRLLPDTLNTGFLSLEKPFLTAQSYPNPTEGMTHFSYEGNNEVPQSGELYVYDVFGKHVFDQSFKASKSGLVKTDLSALKAGVYFYQLTIGNTTSELSKLTVF